MTKLREGYKETEIGVIPEDWEVTTVKNVCNISTGKKNTQDKIEDGEYPFFVRSQKIERINSYSFDGEAVLTAGDGVGTGKVFHFINGKFDIHQRVYKMTDFKSYYNAYFFYLYFGRYFYDRVKRMSAKTSVDSVRMEMISDMQIPLPPLPEQQRIAEILSTTDEHIEKLDKTIEDYQLLKKGMIKKLLTEGIGHTEFKKTEIGRIPKEWEVEEVDKTFQKQTKSLFKQFKTNEYQECGNYPIIDQGKEFISGFTNDAERTYMGELPIVIFGDHTRNLKYIDFKFAVGADGTQILKPNSNEFNAKFYYYSLKNISLANQGYHRHFKFLKENKIAIPKINEQNEITSILDAIDDRQRIFIQEKQDFIQLKKALMEKLLTGKIRTI